MRGCCPWATSTGWRRCGGGRAGCTVEVTECRKQEGVGVESFSTARDTRLSDPTLQRTYAFFPPRSKRPPSRSPSQSRMPSSPPLPPPPQLWKLKPEATLDELEGPSIIDAEVMPVALHYEDVHQFQVCVNKCEHNAPELPAEVIFCTHTH